MRKTANLRPEKVFAFFEELCAIPHGSGDMKRIAGYCVEFAKDRNLKFYRDSADNVVIFKNGTKGFEKSEPVDVVIRPEDIDIVPPDDGHLCGTVTSVTFKGVHYDTIVDFKGFKWLIQTTDFYEVGSYIGIRLEPEDIHIMHKSEYSGMFGDYSSYSAEYDEMDDPEVYLEGGEEAEESAEGGEDEE